MTAALHKLRGHILKCYISSVLKRVREQEVTMATSAISAKQQTTYTRVSAAVANRSNSSLVEPTEAKRQQSSINVYGKELVDHYAWLQDKRNKEVLQYIGHENRYFKSAMAETEKFQQTLIQEIIQNDKVPTGRPPQVIEDYVYYHKHGGNPLPIYCRHRKGIVFEEVVVDFNIIAAAYQQPYVNITTLKISPSQKHVAVVIETPDSDIYYAQIWKIGKPSPITVSHLQQHIHNHEDGKCSHNTCEHADHHGDQIDGIAAEHAGHSTKAKDTPSEDVNEQLQIIYNVFNVEWSSGDVLYYTSSRNYTANQVWRHQVGTSISNDVKVFEEESDRYFVDISKTKDRRYVTINSSCRSSSEVRLIDCECENSSPVLVQTRQDGVEYFIEHSNGMFYILTNSDGAKDYKFMKVPSDSALTAEHWQTIYIAESNTKIVDMDIFDTYCVLLLKMNGLAIVKVLPLDNSSDGRTVQLPSFASTLDPKENPDFYSTNYKFTISSPCLPDVPCEVDLKSFQLKESYIDDSHNKYKCQRLFTASKDGTMVPMSVFYKTDLQLDGSHPMLIHCYGAYGKDLDMEYKPGSLTLLDRGWILAFIHVRGGAELGRQWYYDGRLEKKHKSFEDFEACVEHLYDTGYSTSALTAGYGVSAGGLLLASVCNRSPHLLKAVILKVPFVDVLNTMLTPSLPLTTQDYGEWGNPSQDEHMFDYIRSYCPYQNVTEQTYPSMLVTASMNDIRVPFWAPLKYVAKRRHFTTCKDQSLLLYQFNTGAGHTDDDGHEQTALEYAFLYKALGLSLE
ncbi:prolyl endopeptidase-like [Glandiceps talaboti]